VDEVHAAFGGLESAQHPARRAFDVPHGYTVEPGQIVAGTGRDQPERELDALLAQPVQ